MQNLKVLSFIQRSILLKRPARSTCITEYLQFHGKPGHTNNATRCLISCTRLVDQQNTFIPVHSVICKRLKQSSSESNKSIKDVPEEEEPPRKLSLFQRYKKMLKEYWYILIPVHMVTSAIWFGGFFYAATCGIDIVPFLEYINLPEVLITPLRSSALGHIAVASALYKLATPGRYMVTLGGTSVSIKFLVKRGLIKPVPTKAQIKTIIQNKLKKDK